MMSAYLLYGSGGHAKVVLECLLSEKKSVAVFFDDNSSAESFNNIPILSPYKKASYSDNELIITIGNNLIRKQISEKVFHKFGKTVFSNNIISSSAIISEGSMILQGAILNADCVIGKHVIVNTRAIVEHDCNIGDFVHLAPGSVVCGNTSVGEGTLIGANAVIAPNLKIGKWCRISAGSSVLENIPDNSTVTGVPGKVISKT